MRDTIEVQEIKTIRKEDLLAECAALQAQGMRLVQVLALNTDGGFELSYSFGKEYRMLSLRFTITSDEPVPSITPVWKAAFLYENEIKDLFGVKIENISVDYNGKFYNVAREHPFAARKLKENENK
jgi:NADH:ubiquinone oxidoreductase 27 kD subunit